MPKLLSIRNAPTNYLLERLPPADRQRLSSQLRLVPLEFKKTLYEPGARIDYAYFPTRGVVSALTLMQDGSAIEAAGIGNEGMVGLPLFLEAEISPLKVIVQVEGEAYRMKADALAAECRRDSALRRLLVRYHVAFLTQVAQSVACNGLHTIHQRCCRWLLKTHDCAGADTFPLTHEFLAIMLGVRRASVTEVLQPLQEAGMIRNKRGTFTILDRVKLEAAACECYRTVTDALERLLGK